MYNSGLSSWSFNQRREGKISFDIATAVRVNSLYEKVQRFKERIKSSRRIWILYVVQAVIQAVLTLLFLILNLVLMRNLKGSIKCSVNSVFIPVMHDHFTCTHNLQDVFEKTLHYLFLPLLALCFYIFTNISVWTLWNTQYHSKNKSELDDYIANLHESEKDTTFLLQLLKAYDRQYAEQFHSYMKEDFYKKWKAHILKLKWPSSKLEKLCEDHTNECKRLALTALLGIPETLFALNRLNKLELKLISELENDDFQQFKKLENLIDLALIECNLNEIPQTIFDMSWLKVLTLKYNLISTIGDAIRKLENLTSLNLSHNKLVSIDRSLEDLRNLHILDLSENPDLEMTTIKTALACETLQDLKLSKSTEKKLDNNDLEKFLRLSGKLTPD